MLPLDEIRADIAAFADNEEDVIIEGGLILFQRDGQTVECRLSEKPGEPIEVEHSGRTLPYSRFLGEELGRLGVIAQAIKQRREDVKFYVDTQGVLEDAIGREDGSQSALSILRSRCSDRTPGVTNLIFLTADAGDGKSAVLRRLALTAAQDYIDRHANWVLLHIDTHGRSFIRLEEAVAAELGRLRISGVFYSGVLRLVRHGLLVIAVDGFDELLAEVGFGEAYSGFLLIRLFQQAPRCRVGRGPAAVSEESASVSGGVRDRGGLPEVPGCLSLARRVPLSSVWASAGLHSRAETTVAVRGVSTPGLVDVGNGAPQYEDPADGLVLGCVPDDN